MGLQSSAPTIKKTTITTKGQVRSSMLEGRQAATTNRQKAQGSAPSFNQTVAKKEALYPKGRAGRKDPGMVASVCVPGSGQQ